MNSDSAPALRREDRPDFERALEEALGCLDGGSQNGLPLTVEQLRAMAMSAIEPIAACAAPEYQQYLKHRAQADLDRQPALSLAVAEAPASGAGLFAVVAVLTPILAGTAALIFLLLGYVLHAVQTPEPAIAAPLRTAGWLFASIAALGILAGMVGLVSTALRNGSTAIRDAGRATLPPEAAAARDAWLAALGDRGLQPFLDEALAQAADGRGRYDDTRGAYEDERGAYDSAARGTAGSSRIPRLGYSRPDFSSPSGDEDPHDSGPRYSSPRFSSPDFGGPDDEAR